MLPARAILFTKEIVIHFGPTSTLGEVTSWRAVRAGQRLATTGAQNHDPDTSPCEVADVLSFAKVLAEVRMTSVTGVRTAQCVAELLLNAQGVTVYGLETRRYEIGVPAIGRGLQRRLQHPLDRETRRNKDTF